MIKKLIAIVAVLVLGLGGVAFASQNKVVICHHDQGNSGKDNVTIEVNENAVQAHINHGDDLGACPEPETPPEEEPTPEEEKPVKTPQNTSNGFSFSNKVKPNKIVPLSEQTGGK